MLTKTEKKLMLAIHSLGMDKSGFLVSPIDLMKIAKVKDVSAEELDKTLNDLSYDGYFDLVLSDRHGEKVYCISLLEKGKGYLRSVKISRRNILFRICLSASLALFSFLIGVILKKVF